MPAKRMLNEPAMMIFSIRNWTYAIFVIKKCHQASSNLHRYVKIDSHFAAQYFLQIHNHWFSNSPFLFQFMSVNVQNVSVVMMNNTFNPSWFLHATAGDLHLDGSTLHNLKTLVVTAALSDARVSAIHSIHSFPRRISNQFLYLLSSFHHFNWLTGEILPPLRFINVWNAQIEAVFGGAQFWNCIGRCFNNSWTISRG